MMSEQPLYESVISNVKAEIWDLMNRIEKLEKSIEKLKEELDLLQEDYYLSDDFS